MMQHNLYKRVLPAFNVGTHMVSIFMFRVASMHVTIVSYCELASTLFTHTYTPFTFVTLPIFFHSFTEMQDMVVQQLVVSETHVAMLTDDGRICRIRYTEETTPPQQLVTPTTGREKRYIHIYV